jgi:hypothetical protein
VRTNKGKEFFKDMLKQEGIKFQVCRNPDVKWAVIERAHHTIRDTLYRYFTYRKCTYIDVLPKFVKAYDTIHSTTGMVPTKVNDLDMLTICRRMNHRRRVRSVKAKFQIGQHVRISKEKLKFAKGTEQNYSKEIFRIIKVIHRIPHPVYELEDLNKTLINGQFYVEELTPVRIMKRTDFVIDKILGKLVKRGILEYLVRWKGYANAFDLWIQAFSVKNI